MLHNKSEGAIALSSAYTDEGAAGWQGCTANLLESSALITTKM